MGPETLAAEPSESRKAARSRAVLEVSWRISPVRTSASYRAEVALLTSSRATSDSYSR